jgi:hypothetical protein
MPAETENKPSLNDLLYREYLNRDLLKLFFKSKDLDGNNIDLLDDGAEINILHFLKNSSATIYKMPTDFTGYIIVVDNGEDNPMLEIVWKGTCNLTTVMMDLEAGGAGYQSYLKNEQNIIEKINNIVEQTIVNLSAKQRNQKVDISISGYSLGGALAQLTLTSILKNIGDQKTGNTVNAASLTSTYINSLELTAFNATGVNLDVANQCYSYAQLCNKNGDLPITANYVRIAGDIVPRTGETDVLSFPGNHYRLNTFNFRLTIPQYLSTLLAIAAISLVSTSLFITATLPLVSSIILGLSIGIPTYFVGKKINQHLGKISKIVNNNLEQNASIYQPNTSYQDNLPSNDNTDLYFFKSPFLVACQRHVSLTPAPSPHNITAVEVKSSP